MTTEDDKVVYLDSLISFLETRADYKSANSVEQAEVEKLESELKEIELKRQAIEDKLSKANKPHASTATTSKPSSETKARSVDALLGLLWSTILHPEFKIQGTIGQPGQKDKLGYQALMSQVESGKEKKV